MRPLTPKQKIAASLNAYKKLDNKQLGCALKIVWKESRYNVKALNKSSGAAGAYQLMWGKTTWTLDKQTQEASDYMQHRYGSWCNALNFHQRKNWW